MGPVSEGMEFRFEARRDEQLEAMLIGGRDGLGRPALWALGTANFVYGLLAAAGTGGVAVVIWRLVLDRDVALPWPWLAFAIALVLALGWTVFSLPWRLLAARAVAGPRMSGGLTFRAAPDGAESASTGSSFRVSWAEVEAVVDGRRTILVLSGGVALYVPKRVVEDPGGLLAAMRAWKGPA